MRNQQSYVGPHEKCCRNVAKRENVPILLENGLDEGLYNLVSIEVVGVSPIIPDMALSWLAVLIVEQSGPLLPSPDMQHNSGEIK